MSLAAKLHLCGRQVIATPPSAARGFGRGGCADRLSSDAGVASWPTVGDLIDTTEMYLRTIYELTEERIVPLRARIAERLEQSGPTVSQTVARMERAGLLTVEGDRHLELSAVGLELAERVMRKHRIAERMLVDIIGLDIEQVHEEACRWEHVMSDEVERRLLALLDTPTESPFGNPIPALNRLGIDVEHPMFDLVTFATAATIGRTVITLRRIGESRQDATTMRSLRTAGISVGSRVTITRSGDAVICESMTDGSETGLRCTLTLEDAAHLYGDLSHGS
jgi:DtxR family transcriptional regulator, Mn-dependent transcriptional regulator